MSPGDFVLMTRAGSIRLGVFPELPWHKQERENMLRALGISVEHGEELRQSVLSRVRPMWGFGAKMMVPAMLLSQVVGDFSHPKSVVFPSLFTSSTIR
jgi:hypothetical protein